MEPIYKTGILRSFNAKRGFGFVTETTNTLPVKKYFLHISMVKDGPNPPQVGSIVRFTPGPVRKAGELPSATDAWIVEIEKPTAEVR